jgi:hypothetical protein
MPSSNHEIPFPFGGLSLSEPASQQPQGTTAVGHNVRSYDALQRQRGGSRAGISRFIDEAVGSGAIQHLNLIVTTHADALGWSFNGRDFGFTGVYGGIGFFGLPAGDDESARPEGGGGYQTQDDDRYRVTMAVDDDDVPADGVSDATITVTVEELPGSPPDTEHTVELRTHIAGRVGDRIQGQTDVGGQVQFNVTNTREEGVVYSARDITARVRAENTVTVNFTESTGELWIIAISASISHDTPDEGTIDIILNGTTLYQIVMVYGITYKLLLRFGSNDGIPHIEESSGYVPVYGLNPAVILNGSNTLTLTATKTAGSFFYNVASGFMYKSEKVGGQWIQDTGAQTWAPSVVINGTVFVPSGTQYFKQHQGAYSGQNFVTTITL